MLSIKNSSFKSTSNQFLKQIPSETFKTFSPPLLFFIYFENFYPKALKRYVWMIEKRVRKFTYCFPIPNFLSLFHIHKYFATFFPEGTVHELSMAGVETHKWNIKIICLTHIFFHLLKKGGVRKGALIIKWFFSSSSLLCRTWSDMWMLHAQETTEKIINGKTKSRLYEYQMRLCFSWYQIPFMRRWRSD